MRLNRKVRKSERSTKSKKRRVEKHVIPDYTLDNLEQPLAHILRCGYHGGHLTIRHTESDRWIKFRKFIVAEGEYGLELCFPNMPWSNDYFERLREYCVESQTPFVIERDDTAQPTESLVIGCGTDLSMACALARVVLARMFSLPMDTKYCAEPDHYSGFDELIDNPNQRPVTWWGLSKKIKEKDNFTIWNILGFLLLVILQALSVLGLLITMFLTGDEWRRIDVNVWGVSLDFTVVALIWIILIILCIPKYVLFYRVREEGHIILVKRGPPCGGVPGKTPIWKVGAVVLLEPFNLVGYVVIALAFIMSA